MGIVAVNAIALLFVPHWTAVFFTLPFITLLYCNMLGWLYITGVNINALSYITLVMSIGKYFRDRRAPACAKLFHFSLLF